MKNIHRTAIFVHDETNLVLDQMTVEEDPQLKRKDMYVSVENVYYRIIQIRKVWNSRKDSVQYVYFVNDIIEDKMSVLIPYID